MMKGIRRQKEGNIKEERDDIMNGNGETQGYNVDMEERGRGGY